MNIKKLVVEFVTVFAVALVTTAIVTFLMEHHRAWRKHHRLGNLIPLCDHLRHHLDMGKSTGNQSKIDFLKI